MRSTLDHLLLSLAPVGPVLGTAFRRFTHDPASRIICFLPWRTRFGFAQLAGLVTKRFYACYELPGAVVSPEPGLSAHAIRRVTRDAEQLVRTTPAPPETFTVVGMSMGTVPATLLANRLQCRLCSIGSADRGD